MLKRPNSEMEAAPAAAAEGIQQDLDEKRGAEARKARQLVMPADAEDAAITAAALTDSDNPPLTKEQLGQFKPARHRRGRPAKDVTKVLVSIRFDAS
jgi:uncharacterized protein (DUF4415 family)